MPTMLNSRLKSWFAAVAVVLLVASQGWAQQTPQNFDNTWANGNAPYSNAAPAEHRAFQPFAPVGFIQKFQPFAPADVSDYGDGPKAKRGFFFSYERVLWTMSRPHTTDIGSPDAAGNYANAIDGLSAIYETNTANTGPVGSKFGWGNRWEVGYMDTNDYGWLIGVIDHVSQNQQYEVDNATVLFNDPSGILNGYLLANPNQAVGVDADLNNNQIFGRDGTGTLNASPPPQYTTPFTPHAPDSGLFNPITGAGGDQVAFLPKFQFLNFSQNTLMSGVEIMRMYRAPRLHHGGYFELLYGVRFLQLQDKFLVLASGSAPGISYVNPLDAFALHQQVQNNIIGPQIGGRFSHQRGRWIVNAEGRFFAAANFQNTRQKAIYGTNYPTPTAGTEIRNAPEAFNAYGSNHWLSQQTFTPGVEFRIGTSYQLTRAFALKIGYTALYMDGLKRASDSVQYTLPAFSILSGGNHESFFVNGLSLGFEFNR